MSGKVMRGNRTVGLKILHLLLINVRFLTGNRIESDRLYLLLDQIEVLPELLENFWGENVRLFQQVVTELADMDPIFSDAATQAKQLKMDSD